MRRTLALILVPLASLSLHAGAANAADIPAQRGQLVPVGKLTIPRLQVSETIYKGVTDDQFDVGVGYWPGTALPGARGNMVIGGHRTSAHRPFYDIQKLKVGDLIVVSRPQRTVRYRVTRTFVVRPTAIWIVRPTKAASITLFTCHPRGSISHRYVVRATLVK